MNYRKMMFRNFSSFNILPTNNDTPTVTTPEVFTKDQVAEAIAKETEALKKGTATVCGPTQRA
jgi:hypothetical protein